MRLALCRGQTEVRLRSDCHICNKHEGVLLPVSLSGSQTPSVRRYANMRQPDISVAVRGSTTHMPPLAASSSASPRADVPFSNRDSVMTCLMGGFTPSVVCLQRDEVGSVTAVGHRVG